MEGGRKDDVIKVEHASTYGMALVTIKEIPN